jgi:hypothetical protein
MRQAWVDDAGLVDGVKLEFHRCRSWWGRGGDLYVCA